MSLPQVDCDAPIYNRTAIFLHINLFVRVTIVMVTFFIVTIVTIFILLERIDYITGENTGIQL